MFFLKAISKPNRRLKLTIPESRVTDTLYPPSRPGAAPGPAVSLDSADASPSVWNPLPLSHSGKPLLLLSDSGQVAS